MPEPPAKRRKVEEESNTFLTPLSKLPSTLELKDCPHLLFRGGSKDSELTHLTPTMEISNRFGQFRANDVIGKQFGDRVKGRKAHKGKVQDAFMLVLKPSPINRMDGLQKRTQILFESDISMILLRLGLKNGSRVVESGTGSANLSHAIAYTIAPKGHLYTFEFHEGRYLAAKKDFTMSGLNPYVTLKHADATKGFEVDGPPVDAVFLDLPHPWLCIDHVNAVLKHEGMLCSFSPCIEQVQKTNVELWKKGYTDIHTFETLARNFKRVETEKYGEVVFPKREMRGHTGYLTFACRI